MGQVWVSLALVVASADTIMSWWRSISSAVSAIQFLSITSHGLKDPWIPVQCAIYNIRWLICMFLDGTGSSFNADLLGADVLIYMTRRVFTEAGWFKILLYSQLQCFVYQIQNDVVPAPNVLSNIDGSHNWSCQVASRWHVSTKLTIDCQLYYGRRVMSNDLKLSEGYFVDVKFGFSILCRGGGGYHYNFVPDSYSTVSTNEQNGDGMLSHLVISVFFNNDVYSFSVISYFSSTTLSLNPS